ncbi:unnamed protein product [Fraxinus pennsylvanica]|uniref:HMA domain-containing protein n=1 Tax=Fraxinus pennsylvanica TaxID=56036 RepID=A0AAD2DK03_9LAMI|nr:unnamed protein product [Fraxinus pennsylvanica]
MMEVLNSICMLDNGQACKMKMMEVLNSICGVYSVTIDAEEGTARVSGLVDPNILMRALTRTGYHAELKWVKLKHQELSRGYNYGHGYNYGAIDDPYRSSVDSTESVEMNVEAKTGHIARLPPF